MTELSDTASAAHAAPVADGIYRLGDRYTNWYVIDEGGRLALVDTGLPADWDQLTSLLESIGRTLADVEAIVLTHNHPDHVGNAEHARLEARARVLVHEADADGVRQGGGSPPALGLIRSLVRPAVARYMLHTARAGGMRKRPVRDIATFGDNDRLDVPGTPLVIHTPGHTPGECAFYLDQRAVLLTGDALVTLDVAPAIVGPTLLTAPFVLDPRQALASLDRLEATGAQTVLPGHGKPWRKGVEEAVRLARARAAS